jgi:hypothetical protein
VDFYDSQKNVVDKVSFASAVEFMADSYASMWQNILRNGNESMVGVLMRLVSRKRYVQRTNDFKAKGIVDFFATTMPTSNVESSDVFLFGTLLGLLPRQTTFISPGTYLSCFLITLYFLVFSYLFIYHFFSSFLYLLSSICYLIFVISIFSF